MISNPMPYVLLACLLLTNCNKKESITVTYTEENSGKPPKEKSMAYLYVETHYEIKALSRVKGVSIRCFKSYRDGDEFLTILTDTDISVGKFQLRFIDEEGFNQVFESNVRLTTMETFQLPDQFKEFDCLEGTIELIKVEPALKG